MSEPILDPQFWQDRLHIAIDREQVHHAIYDAPLELWHNVARKHTEILARHIQPTDSIFDAGCGWGRLLSMLPSTWTGNYIGMDLSPDFIRIARRAHDGKVFIIGKLHDSYDIVSALTVNRCAKFDWAVCVSIRQMVRDNTGLWPVIEANLRSIAKRILILEYDLEHEGEVLE